MKITLLGLNHEVQWKDPTGDLHRILNELIATSQIVGEAFAYVPAVDDVRENHWLTRLLRWKAQSAVYLCGRLHVETFTKKLQEKGCTVEQCNLTELSWFRELYGIYSIVEQDGRRRVEIRRV